MSDQAERTNVGAIIESLRTRAEQAEAERDEARAERDKLAAQLRGAEGVRYAALMRLGTAHKTIARLNRRAQEAERIALHAMRVGLHEAEGLRALVVYWRREAKRRLVAPPIPIKAAKLTCRSTHHAGCDCHEARRDALIASLTAERDEARAALAYESETAELSWVSIVERAAKANAEFALGRYRAGNLVEGDESSEDWRCDGCGAHEWDEHNDCVRRCRSCGARMAELVKPA